MTSEELSDRLRAFLSGIDVERRFLQMCFDLRDTVRDRVQNAGLNNRDTPFVPYTPGYAKTRLKKGFQARKVDYTRTGRLWGSIIPEVVSSGDGVVVVEIGPRGRDNEVKLLGAGTLKPRKDGQLRGLVTLPSERELEDAFTDLVEGILDEFENVLR